MADDHHFELPQSDEAERSVLGAVFVDNDRLDDVAELLRPEDFYRAPHQRIFRHMLALAVDGRPIDLITLHDRLEADGGLEAVGGAAYLAQLLDGVPRLINARHHAEIVRERSVRRQLIRTAGEIATEASAGEMTLEQLLGDAERRVFAIAEQRMAPGFESMATLLERTMTAIEERQAAESPFTGVPTGFDRFDELTSGLQSGDLVILAARPSMGKTAWALSAAQNAAIRHGRKVAIFSLEMSAQQLVLRMLFSEARVDSQLMRRGKLTDRHWSRLADGFNRLARAGIFMDDSTGTTPAEMRAKCRRLKAEQGLDLVVVDYLQLMTAGGRFENRQQEISTISRSLKGMARELGVPVLALSQLSRAPDQRTGDHRPHLSDLRESGSLEQDADVVAFIFRPEVYAARAGKDPGDDKGVAEIIIAKQRNGPTDSVKLAFVKQWTRFENWQRDEPSGPLAPSEAVYETDEAEVDDRAPF